MTFTACVIKLLIKRGQPKSGVIELTEKETQTTRYHVCTISDLIDFTSVFVHVETKDLESATKSSLQL